MAYNAAFFLRREQNADRSSTLVFRYSGNAGEPTIDVNYPIDTTVMPSADSMRALAMARIAKMNNDINFAIGADPFLNTFLDVTTPLPSASTSGAFAAAAAAFTPGTNAQDVLTITGSATRTVQVQRITLSTTQNTAGTNAWFLVKRSSANTGGTSAPITAVPLNDVFPSATATVLRYTANPTAGTLIGGIASEFIASPAPASPLPNAQKVFDSFATGPIVLSGTTDVLGVNFGAAAIPAGLSVLAAVSWSEF